MPMNWKKLAIFLEEQNQREYIKAQIFLHAKEALFDLDIDEDLFDDYIEHGYKIWAHSSYIQPAHIGDAIYLGLQNSGEVSWEDYKDVIVYGLELRMGQDY